MKTYIYCSGTNDLEVPKRHFLKAEKEMLDYFKLEKNYNVSFNGWIMTIKNDELEKKSIYNIFVNASSLYMMMLFIA